jgi:hypothetical protein
MSNHNIPLKVKAQVILLQFLSFHVWLILGMVYFDRFLPSFDRLVPMLMPWKGLNTLECVRSQRMLGGLLDGLAASESVLKASYQNYFATAPRPAPPREGYRPLTEFRINPSEMLHMEFLLRLQKYAE